MTDYYAPASEPLTVLHQRDPAVPAVEETRTCPASLGRTACCGRVMWVSELWMLIDEVPGDRVCQGAEPATAEMF